MAYFYMDTDAGSNANDGSTWALAKSTLEGLLGAMAAGDKGVIQGVASDTAAVGRTFNSPGTVNTPCTIIGVKAGTTNTGPNIVEADVLRRGIDTLVHIEVTGATNDITMTGSLTIHGMWFAANNRFEFTAESSTWNFYECELVLPDIFHFSSGSCLLTDCKLEATTSSFRIWTRETYLEQPLKMYGGEFLFTVSPAISLFHSTLAKAGALFVGVDMSSMGNIAILEENNAGTFEFINCRFPAAYSLTVSPLLNDNCIVKLIGCTNNVIADPTLSNQAFQSRTTFGDVATSDIVRTGGADDNASGQFSYAMTPSVNGVLESSKANLASPWLSVWVNAGSKTVTVYIANSAIAAATDYLQIEAFCEFYSPDQAGTAQHEQNFDPDITRGLESSGPLKDDITSIWSAGGNNPQKFEVAINPGFEGVLYARVHLAKRQATPDTLYLDPRIGVV